MFCGWQSTQPAPRTRQVAEPSSGLQAVPAAQAAQAAPRAQAAQAAQAAHLRPYSAPAQPASQPAFRSQQLQSAPAAQHQLQTFAAFDDLMLSPFGGFGRRGGGLFGDLFGHMDSMIQEMEAVSMRGGQMATMHHSGGDGMMMRGFGDGGGSYSCQTFMFSSGVGADGQVHTEKFASSAVGNFDGKMHEVQQAYSNSMSGVDKMSLERQLDGRGRKVVKERSRLSGEERQTDMFKGMTEDQYGDFDRQWQQQAAPRLPHHMGVQQYMLGGPGGRATPSLGAVPAAATAHRPMASQLAYGMQGSGLR